MAQHMITANLKRSHKYIQIAAFEMHSLYRIHLCLVLQHLAPMIIDIVRLAIVYFRWGDTMTTCLSLAY